MTVGPVTASPGLAAIALGAQQRLRVTVQAEALRSAGLLDQHLADAFRAIDASAVDLIHAGVAAIQQQMLGSLLDLQA